MRGSAADENPSGLLFRARAVSKLGDIVDSTPRYEAAPGLPYPDSFGVGAPETSYSAYQTTQINRTPVIYVGANDGMLHAFNATSSGGQEIFAYVPNGVFTNLNKLTSINYNSTHQFFVDGSPSVSDAFFAGTWHTLVAGGLNKGGKSIYALDVTNPTSFGTSNVLWEFTDAADLGFTYSQPAIVRMHNGHWVVVFGNGYNSTNGKAVLFIRDLEDGTVTKIDTGVGVSTSADGTTPNGLATVAPVDVNGDTIVDYIYAGDLQGNMWKFDVTGNTAGSWGVAYNSGATKLPLFTACVASPCTLLNRQQITTRPDVAPKSGGGQIVLFGTGKYLESVDITRISPTNTFYGIYDNNTPNASFVAPVKSSLLQQQVLQELTVSGSSFRTTSNNALTNQPGWYINLPTVAPPGTLPATGREMQVTDSVLRSGRILFATLIPASDPCGFGGTSWLMALDARTGSRLGISLFDVNGDGYFTSADFVTSGGITVPVSGRQSREGVVGTPTILGTGNGDLLIGSGSSGNLDVNKAENNSNKGRQSFHQLQ